MNMKIGLIAALGLSMATAPTYAMKDLGLHLQPYPTPNTKRGKFKSSSRNKKRN